MKRSLHIPNMYSSYGLELILEDFQRKRAMFRIGVRQCPFLLYLLHLASYDVFEQEGLEKPYLCRQTEIGIYHFMTEEELV